MSWIYLYLSRAATCSFKACRDAVTWHPFENPPKHPVQEMSKTLIEFWLLDWLRVTLSRDNNMPNKGCVRAWEMRFPKIFTEASWGWRKGMSSQEPTLMSGSRTQSLLSAFYCSSVSIGQNNIEVKEVCTCLCSILYTSWYLLHS